MSTEQREIITETDSDDSKADFELTAERADDSSGEGTLIEKVVDALFDDGKGEMTEVYADTDGDGRIDIAVADTDGDGNIDMAVVDTDGDGMLDTGVADLDGDGTVDMVAVDTDGDGMLDTAIVDTDGDGKADMVAIDTDGDGMLDTAFADTDGDGVIDTVMTDTDGDGEFDTVEAIEDTEADTMMEAEAGFTTDEELSMNSVEFNLGSEGFPEIVNTVPEGEITFDQEIPAVDEPYFAVSEPIAQGTFDPGTPSTDEAYLAESGLTGEESVDPAIAEKEAHAETAREAQLAADDLVEKGDYRAAADAREQAEQAAGEAGDTSMLGAYDAQDLEHAADKQDKAAEFREQQAEKLAEGDYEGARLAAFESEWATRDADMNAGGADRTGQAQADQANLEWASYHQEIADDNARNAEVYAAEGDFDKAEMYADQAAGSEAVAGDYGQQADPNNIMYDVDHSSAVETGGTYDASVDSVDTGFDASVDTAPASFDTSSDDTL